jgi:hypothetical protein
MTIQEQDDLKALEAVWPDIPRRYKLLIVVKCFFYAMGARLGFC